MMFCGSPDETAIVPNDIRQGSSSLVPGGVGSVGNFAHLRPPSSLVPAITALPSSEQQPIRASDALLTTKPGVAGVQSSCGTVIKARSPGPNVVE
jgi:hypothetical protein